MKLQIKTLNQKSLLIEIDEKNTVYDLKKLLARYPDVGVEPELQKIIYAGKVLTNDDPLSTYDIDIRKVLVVMVLKQPLEDSPTTSKPTVEAPTAPTTTAAKKATVEETPKETTPPTTQPLQKAKDIKETEAAAGGASNTTERAGSAAVGDGFKTPAVPQPAAEQKSQTEELIESIVNMGYMEGEVRRALAASFNNPERAIEYLIEGIPVTPAALENSLGADTETDEELTPFEIFRTDPLFRSLRRAIQQHPELIDDAIARVGEANPSILNLINENQQEFLAMLIENSEDEDDDFD